MNTQQTFGKRSNLTKSSPAAYVASIKRETEAQEAARIAADWTGEAGKPLPIITGKTR